MKLHPIVCHLLLSGFVAFTVAGAEEPGRLEGVVGTADGQPVSNAWVFVYSAAPREGPSVICPTLTP